MKSLIIAEKPSVARDIATAIGKFKKDGEIYENDEYVISSAIGHLVELFMPEDIDKKLSYWKLDTLPILPETFKLKPIDKTKDRFALLKKLLARKDIDTVINACDAGREGELIFTYIYELAKCKKPAKRMWMQSMTKDAIRKAFANLRDEERMRPLQDAARCRSEADWLIGINGTRAVTKRLFGGRAGNVAPVGRVQTPTLSLVYSREQEIENFKPRTYWQLEGEFEVAKGTYKGVAQRSDFKKGSDEHDKVDRFWNKEEVEALLNSLKECDKGLVTETKKRTRQAPPRLYDLTTLQREANNRFGLPANRTLQIAQALYEKHKMITYPRTDSKALPEDYIPNCKDTLGKLTGDIERYAQEALAKNWVKPNKRIFNNAQVSDHFAIIPTGENKKLTDMEEKVYDMIVRRFISVFFPSAEFDVTVRMTKLKDIEFKTQGKVLVEPGFLAVLGRGEKAVVGDELPALSSGDGEPPEAKVNEINLKEDETKPPARYTEATLLSAMETAGKLVDDEELAEAMKESGLGTPATRAQIIEGLLGQKYMERQGKELIPTAKAQTMLEFLNIVHAEALTSPSLTGEWEKKLHEMEDGKMSREAFMKGIRELTIQLVERTRNWEEDAADAPLCPDLIAPTDGKPMREFFRSWDSQDGEIRIYKNVGNRKMEIAEIKELLANRRIGPLDGFRSKAGKPYSAILELNEENKVRFVFENNGLNGEKGSHEEVDISKFPAIGKCPKDGARVLETPNAYACENALNGSDACDFRISRVMLEATISPENIKKLLETGKTNLIPNFRSKRTKRLFKAYLVLQKGGKIGFEFEPRGKATKATPPKKEA